MNKLENSKNNIKPETKEDPEKEKNAERVKKAFRMVNEILKSQNSIEIKGIHGNFEIIKGSRFYMIPKETVSKPVTYEVKEIKNGYKIILEGSDGTRTPMSPKELEESLKKGHLERIID